MISRTIVVSPSTTEPSCLKKVRKPVQIISLVLEISGIELIHIIVQKQTMIFARQDQSADCSQRLISQKHELPIQTSKLEQLAANCEENDMALFLQRGLASGGET